MTFKEIWDPCPSIISILLPRCCVLATKNLNQLKNSSSSIYPFKDFAYKAFKGPPALYGADGNNFS